MRVLRIFFLGSGPGFGGFIAFDLQSRTLLLAARLTLQKPLLAFKLVQAKSRGIQRIGSLGHVQQGENVFDFLNHVRTKAARVAVFVQPL